jgi:hypothetical protein
MKTRCLNPKFEAYKNYGGRGIKVCERWLNFVNFFEDMGDPEDHTLTLDRIDNNGDYSKSNCRWATRKEQCHNMRKNVWITHNGQTKIQSDWAREFCVSDATIWRRLHRGVNIETGEKL